MRLVLLMLPAAVSLSGCVPASSPKFEAGPRYQLCSATTYASVQKGERTSVEKADSLFRLDTITGDVWQLVVTDLDGTNDVWRKVTPPAP